MAKPTPVTAADAPGIVQGAEASAAAPAVVAVAPPSKSGDRFVPSHFVAGAMAGAVAAFVTCPIEVVKTRMQASGGTLYAATSGRKFSPIRHLAAEIAGVAKREGVRGLWRGVGPQVLGVAPARAIYFHVYNWTRAQLDARGVHGSWLHLGAASASGMVTATALSPVHVIKTRLQIQTNEDAVSVTGKRLKNYTSAMDALRGIVKEEGWMGLYRGLSASYLGVTESASHFVMFQAMKVEWRERGYETTPFTSFCMAAASKLVASAATYPHEVIRTRLRDRVALADPDGPRYRGLLHAFRRVAAEEGVAGLYAGMGPHLIRVVPNAAILFCIMDILLNDQL